MVTAVLFLGIAAIALIETGPTLYVAIFVMTAHTGLARSVRAYDPLKWFLCTWAIACAPYATGLLVPRQSAEMSPADSYLFAFVFAFVLGNLLIRGLSPLQEESARATTLTLNSVARQADEVVVRRIFITGVLGLGGVAFYAIDLVISGAVSLSATFAEQREAFVVREVGPFGQLASLASWGCLYSFVAALLIQERLTRFDLIKALLPGAAFLAYAVMSSGRQASFQVFLLLIFYFCLRYHVDTSSRPTARRVPAWIAMSAASAGLISYMFIAAHLRYDHSVVDRKHEVLSSLFQIDLSEGAKEVLSKLPPVVSDGISETIYYVGTPIILFRQFYASQPTQLGTHYGLFSFPYVYRRFEVVGAQNVLIAMERRRQLARWSGLMTHGWITAVGSYILDFGFVGAIAVSFSFGAFSGYLTAWRQRFRPLDWAIASSVMCTFTVYTIMFPPTSDTNLLLLMLVALALLFRGRVCKAGILQRYAGPK